MIASAAAGVGIAAITAGSALDLQTESAAFEHLHLMMNHAELERSRRHFLDRVWGDKVVAPGKAAG